MNVELILAPLLVLLIVVLFGFTGCGGRPFTSEDTREEPPEVIKYAELVEATGGFVAIWPMNESAGETIAPALGPPNIDGVYMPGATPGSPGAMVNKDPQNFAPSLDGVTGYVEVPFSPLLNVPDDPGVLGFSVEVWVKPAEAITGGAEQIVISSHHTSDAGNQRGYEIALVDSGATHATVHARVFSINDGATAVAVTPAQGDPLAWRHIVLAYDMAVQNLRLYVNVTGTAFDVTPHEDIANYSPVQEGGAGERPLRFGAGHLQAGGPDGFFKGFIDEVAYYNLALDPTDVETHFQAF